MPAGSVFWGYVGVGDRRTLTVISAEVSHADRLQGLCPLDESNLAISAACAMQLPEGAVRSIRCQSLKGWAAEMAVLYPNRVWAHASTGLQQSLGVCYGVARLPIPAV